MSKRSKWREYEMGTSDEKLKSWLDDCDEWIEATDINDADAAKFLRARLKRAVRELRERM